MRRSNASWCVDNNEDLNDLCVLNGDCVWVIDYDHEKTRNTTEFKKQMNKIKIIEYFILK